MIQLFSVKDLSKKYTHPQKLKVFKKIMRFLKVCTNTPEIRVLKKTTHSQLGNVHAWDYILTSAHPHSMANAKHFMNVNA